MNNKIGKIKDFFVRNNLTFGIAESCTGGLISNLITDVSGSSLFFKGAVVAYSNEIKTSVLKVPSNVVAKYGAVSSHVAYFMVKGVQSVLDIDVGVSITGIAGPLGGTEEKAVGLAYVGFIYKNIVKIRRLCFDPDLDRISMKESFANWVLMFVLKNI